MAENHPIMPPVAAPENTLPPVSGGMKNRYFVRDGHVVIILVRKDVGELECLIDIEDFPTVSAIHGTWHATWSKNIRNYYANTDAFETVGGKSCRVKGSSISMHRLILGVPPRIHVDHVNQADTLDNRRRNIRGATPLQNSLNHRESTVTQRSDQWHVRLFYKGHAHSLGRYQSETEALAIRAGACLLADSLEAKENGLVSLAEHREVYDLKTGLPEITPCPILPRKFREPEPKPARMPQRLGRPKTKPVEDPKIFQLKPTVFRWLRESGYSRCFACSEVKCLNHFSPKSLYLCRECNTRRCRERYQTNPDIRSKMNAAAAEWRRNNPEKQRLVERRNYLNQMLKKTNPELFIGQEGDPQ